MEMAGFAFLIFLSSWYFILIPAMTETTYICNVCNAAPFPDRARIHCLICPKYDSCADCHITRPISSLGTHRLEHDFAVYRHDRQVLPAGDEPEQTAVRSEDASVARPDDRIVTTLAAPDSKGQEDAAQAPSASAPSLNASPSTCGLDDAASEEYWGNLLTPAKTPSTIFSRLVKAIFAHFDATCSGALQLSEFCALLSAAGFTADQFPPLKVSPGSASPADLHEVDSWLANWMQSFPLDHSMTTRQFPPPPLSNRSTVASACEISLFTRSCIPNLQSWQTGNHSLRPWGWSSSFSTPCCMIQGNYQ
ncbi:hypothetical protein V8F06_013133 [Rhypophila decipiens]